MDENICRFVPCSGGDENIRILYYVLETERRNTPMRIPSVYTLHYVLSGEATLQTAARTYALRPGDLFFCLPSAPYALEGNEDFRFIYVSFLGGRACALLDALGVHAGRCVFSGYEQLRELWLSGLNVGPQALPWRAEGILLYTFSEIGKALAPQSAAQPQSSDAVPRLKKYIDEHFSDPDLSLGRIAQALSYSPKYLSALFKRAFHLSFSEYLSLIRIQHACALMEQGFTCVRDVAALCGFRDPLYFSRVFKARMGLSPREHCAELQRQAAASAST